MRGRGLARCFAWLPLACAACGSGSAPPNLLLVVLDTLRADRLAAYGETRGVTPFLDELAQRSVVFANAYAASSWTSPSVASLLTSRYPSQHRVTLYESVLPPDEFALAERLAPFDFLSGGFSANFRLAANLGYGQGFDAWQVYMGRWVNPDRSPKVRAGHVTARALEWLDGAWSPDSGRPAFLYLQYMEPHSPYDPPEPFRSRFAAPGARPADAAAANRALSERVAQRTLAELRFKDLGAAQVALLESLYDGEVASLDAELRELFAELERRGFLERALVVVTADHGEEFLEHGIMLHGLSLYEHSLRVPLLLSGPGLPPGRVIGANVSLVDVVPTLLDLLGLPFGDRLEGRSLVPLLEAASPEGVDLLFELPPKKAPVELRAHDRGILRGSHKLVVKPDGAAVLYDLAADPVEEVALAAGPDEELRAALERQRVRLAASASGAAETIPLDETTREDLRALGYLVDPEPE